MKTGRCGAANKFFEFPLDASSQVQYIENRYGTFPAVSDAFLRRFLPKLGPYFGTAFFMPKSNRPSGSER
jgi:hypothetical protein